MKRWFIALISAISAALPWTGNGLANADDAALVWQSDYHSGLDRAAAEHKLAILWFCDLRKTDDNDDFENRLLKQPEILDRIAESFVPVRLACDQVIVSGGEKVVLLDHPAFAEMHRHCGLAIIDMTDANGPLRRQVVSVYPFRSEPITAEELVTLLQLPRGTLTQRTLIFAVRTHPERPASARSQFSPLLADETASHARHQAHITLQGHHNWEQRFHAINARLPGGLVAQEVCAESWPGQNLLEAAEECVHSWRQSSGHWSAVSSRQELFAYDMQRGPNGVWYAAGIFARRN